METEKQLGKLGKKKLLKLAADLGIQASDKDPIKHLVQWILDEVDDLNTWLEAKANVKKDMKIIKDSQGLKEGGKSYKGKHPITKEPIYE